MSFKPTVKYEIVFGLVDGENNTRSYSEFDFKKFWMRRAKKFFDEHGVYVSAIAYYSDALYNEEWGCPSTGEPSIVFHCTANPEFIKYMEKYE